MLVYIVDYIEVTFVTLQWRDTLTPVKEGWDGETEGDCAYPVQSEHNPNEGRVGIIDDGRYDPASGVKVDCNHDGRDARYQQHHHQRVKKPPQPHKPPTHSHQSHQLLQEREVYR